MTWTITRRVAAGFAWVLLLLVIVVAAGAVALGRAERSYGVSLADRRTRVLPALQAESELRNAAMGFLRYLLRRDEADLRTRDSSFALARALMAQLRDSARTAQDRAEWIEALGAADSWGEASRSSVAAAGRGVSAELVGRDLSAIWPLMVAARTAIQRGLATAVESNDQAVREADTAAARSRMFLFAAGLAAILAGLVSAALLSRAVSGPLREAVAVLASSSAELLAGASEQAAGAAQTSSAVTETVTTVEEVTQTAQQAAERAGAIERAGRSAAEESAATMGEVKQQVESIAESILGLAEQAQAIGEIIATVSDISEQTNLLALNASVEAARAGEQGRGFAVVAGEVRNLAEQSKKATVQVRQILGEIQRATSAAVMTTEQGTKRVSTGAVRIAEVVGETAQAAAQIVASAGQQAAGVAQIRQAMHSIQAATQQTVASARQGERAAQDLSALGGRLVALVGGGHVMPPVSPYRAVSS